MVWHCPLLGFRDLNNTSHFNWRKNLCFLKTAWFPKWYSHIAAFLSSPLWTNTHKKKQTDSGKENTGLWLKFCFQGRAIPVPWTCQRIHKGFEKLSVTNDSTNASQLLAISTPTPTAATWWTVITSPAAGYDYTPWWENIIIWLLRVKLSFHTLRLYYLINEKWWAMDYHDHDATTVEENRVNTEEV